jgi:hypothetical protein
MIVKSSPGVFKWGHPFQRGDLPIYITDTAGNPLDPYSIKFTLLYQPRKHYEDRPAVPCHPVIAGPCHRVPVQAALGEYYATGCAGECGQPGQWYAKWVVEEYFQGPLLEEMFGFEVFDTAQYFPPGVGMMGRREGHHDEGIRPSCRWCCRPNPCGCANSRGW